MALLVITTLVVLAESVGAEDILGAFIAGIVIKLLQPAHSTQEKLDAIGYGVFIPFFFILTGAKINIPELLASPKTLILIPLFLPLMSWQKPQLTWDCVNASNGSTL